MDDSRDQDKLLLENNNWFIIHQKLKQQCASIAQQLIVFSTEHTQLVIGAMEWIDTCAGVTGLPERDCITLFPYFLASVQSQ